VSRFVVITGLALMGAFTAFAGLALLVGAALPGKGQIAFEAYQNGDWDVYLLDVSHSLTTDLTSAYPDAWNRNAAWSPDGRWLAYTTVVGLDNSDIFVQQIQCPTLFQPCADSTNLTNQIGNDYAPSWSPDGRQMAFISERDYNREVYLMDSDGGNGRNLSQHPDADIEPVWSPDGTQIAFVSERDGSNQVYVTDENGTQPRPLVHSFSRNLAWSPDGSRMTYISSGDIFLIEDGCQRGDGDCRTNARNLTQSQYIEALQSWSPDNRHLVFQINRAVQQQIYTLDVACLDESITCHDSTRLLTAGLDRPMMPTWSPDGSEVVMIANNNGSAELYLVNLNTGTPRRLTQTHTQLYAPRWRPG
jgi:TolB protein